MALSGSTDYTLTASGIIKRAFRKLGINPAETAITAAEEQDGLDTLNLMMKSFQAQGLHLWSREEGIVFLDKGKTDYLLGPSGDEATTLDDFVGTTLSAAEASGQTILSVTSSANMAASDYVGVQLDDGTRQWSTIASVDSSTQITINDALTDDAASGNTVFTFTTLVERPLRITSGRRKTYAVDSEIEIDSFSRSQYFNQVNKTTQGEVTGYYYSPLLTNGRFYVWPTANSVNDYIRFSFQRTLQDVDLTTHNVDFPVEWLEALIYGLAARLADEYDVAPNKHQMILAKAQMHLDEVVGWDQEHESLMVYPG